MKMQPAAPLRGLRILVVEDEYLVAEDLVGVLEGAGAEVIGPLGWVADALTVVADPGERLDGAVLDVNLHGSKSYPVADALIERSIKFVFATGYGDDGVDAPYRDYPRCEKPYNPIALVGALRGLLS